MIGYLRRQQIFDQTGPLTKKRVQSQQTEYPEPILLVKRKKIVEGVIWIRCKQSPERKYKGLRVEGTTAPPESNKEPVQSDTLKTQELAALERGDVTLRTVTASQSLQRVTVKSAPLLHCHSGMTLMFLTAYWLKLEAPTAHGETDQSQQHSGQTLPRVLTLDGGSGSLKDSKNFLVTIAGSASYRASVRHFSICDSGLICLVN